MPDNEISGSIASVRALENAIRASRKYTESVKTMTQTHPSQGDFPSQVLTKSYEVYPGLKVSMGMSVKDLADWLWADVEIIVVRFSYNYRDNVAVMKIHNFDKKVKRLTATISGFGKAYKAVRSVNGNSRPITIVDTLTGERRVVSA